MAKGNKIVVSAEPHGHFVEGIIGAGLTPKPGQVVQRDHSVGLTNGKFTWVLYNSDGDGDRPKGPLIILTEAALAGRTKDVAYAAGENAYGYIPLAGDELNLLIKNETGTADDHAAGEMLVPDDSTGKFVISPGDGTEETEPAQLNEAITDPTADTLAWCTWTGF